MENLAVLIDFDGTAAEINVLDTLYAKFGGPSHHAIMERWKRGEISTMQEMESIFETVTANRQEMEAFLRTVELDPGFKPLLDACQEEGYAFAIVSDGLRWYIDYIVKQNQQDGVSVYACELIFEENGFSFKYPWYDPAYPLRSTAKPVIVKDFQARGYRVVFVGDGLSDIEVLDFADVVYAKDVLFESARAMGIPVKEFGDLNDVVRDMCDTFSQRQP